MKRIAVLGSTGSIGGETLDVIRASNGGFTASVLSARTNAETVLAQAAEFRPALVCIEDEAAARLIEKRLPAGTKLYCGKDASTLAAAFDGADIAVNGISGFAGTFPLIAALRAGKRVALANKESVVCAMPLVKEAIERGKGEIIPVDSEQSAIFQCLEAGRRQDVKKLILTASGGPFRTYTKEALARVTSAEAMKHPTWKMGGKVTLDSATLFNKGLEVIEAAHLFGFPADMISVVIHPQSVVHSMVEFADNSIIAQLAAPDMRLAIRYALTYPERLPGGFGALDMASAGGITFEPPDDLRFPALRLAYEALRAEGLAPCVFSAANEQAGELFMQGRIGFCDIPALVERALEHIPTGGADSGEAILAADAQTRNFVLKESEGLS